jgi:hypothetical protein
MMAVPTWVMLLVVVLVIALISAVMYQLVGRRK